MTGIEGKATVRLAPKGFVKIESELWEARTQSGTIEAGTRIVVVKQEGMKLVVVPINSVESRKDEDDEND